MYPNTAKGAMPILLLFALSTGQSAQNGTCTPGYHSYNETTGTCVSCFTYAESDVILENCTECTDTKCTDGTCTDEGYHFYEILGTCDVSTTSTSEAPTTSTTEAPAAENSTSSTEAPTTTSDAPETDPQESGNDDIIWIAVGSSLGGLLLISGIIYACQRTTPPGYNPIL